MTVEYLDLLNFDKYLDININTEEDKYIFKSPEFFEELFEKYNGEIELVNAQFNELSDKSVYLDTVSVGEQGVECLNILAKGDIKEYYIIEGKNIRKVFDCDFDRVGQIGEFYVAFNEYNEELQKIIKHPNGELYDLDSAGEIIRVLESDTMTMDSVSFEKVHFLIVQDDDDLLLLFNEDEVSSYFNSIVDSIDFNEGDLIDMVKRLRVEMMNFVNGGEAIG